MLYRIITELLNKNDFSFLQNSYFIIRKGNLRARNIYFYKTQKTTNYKCSPLQRMCSTFNHVLYITIFKNQLTLVLF